MLYFGCGEKYSYCDGGWDLRLKIVNNSNENMWVFHSASYPDTSFLSTINDYTHSRNGYIKSGEEQIQGERCRWDDYFNNYVKSDTVMFFFVLDEGQGLDKLDEIHTILKRMDLTLSDLYSMNWTIYYP